VFLSLRVAVTFFRIEMIEAYGIAFSECDLLVFPGFSGIQENKIFFLFSSFLIYGTVFIEFFNTCGMLFCADKGLKKETNKIDIEAHGIFL
jgi:hypothetical protein